MSLSGPSQQFGWVGHGTYAPLNIPNIFKAAGIKTRWIPEVNEIFEAGLSLQARARGGGDFQQLATSMFIEKF